MKGRILYQSPNLKTYKNLVAAMYNAYEEIEEICLSFLDSEVDDKILDDLQLILSSSENQIYKKAARIRLTAESINSQDTSCFQGWNVIDVSAVSKENAVHIVASTLENEKIRVCTLHWLERFGRGEEWILTNDNHRYSDLLSEGSLAKLYKNYFQRKVVIRMFGVMFSLLFFLAVTKYLFPTFQIPDDFINFFSLLIGASGLYLASVSLKERQ